jgi:hypothetical protein
MELRKVVILAHLCTVLQPRRPWYDSPSLRKPRIRLKQSTIFHPISPRYILMLSSYLRLVLPNDLFPSVFPTKVWYSFLTSPLLVTCCVHLILLDLITLIIFGQLVYSSVYIALGYGLDDRGSRVRFPAGARNFLFTTASRTALEPTQFPIQWVPEALSLGVKRPGREADHSPPSSAEVEEYVELYLHSSLRLHGVVLS